MKRLLILVFLLFTLIASVVFLVLYFNFKQFSVDRYRTYFEEALEAQMGGEVTLGNLSVEWGAEPKFLLEDFEYRTEGSSFQLFTAQEVVIPIQVKSWRRRRVVLGPMVVQSGTVDLYRSPKGDWNWKGVGKPKVTGDPIKKIRGVTFTELLSPRAWTYTVRNLEVKDLDIFYSDQSAEPHISHSLKDCLIRIEKPTTFSTFRYELGCQNPIPFLAEGAFDGKQHSMSTEVNFFDEKLVFRGDLLDLNSSPRMRGQIEAHGLNLKSSALSAATSPRGAGEEITGRLTSKLQGVATGTHPVELRESLSGSGPIDIRRGYFRNYNFIQQILKKVYDTSGLETQGDAEAPEAFREVLNGEDVPFDIFQARLRVHQGRVYLYEARVKHTHYFLEAEGSFGWFDQDADFAAKLILYDEISEYLSQRIPRIDVMKSESNRIVIPFNFRGVMPAASVYPDLSLVVSRLKRMIDQEDGTQPLGPEAMAKPPSYEDLVRKIGPEPAPEASDAEAGEEGAEDEG